MALTIIISVVATFTLMSLFFSFFIKRLDDEYTGIIAMCWDQIRKAAKDSGCKTPMDYIKKKIDENYTILLLGKIFTVLNKKIDRNKDKPNPHQDIVNEVGAYLNVELADDIEQYKKNKSGKDDDIKNRIKQKS